MRNVSEKVSGFGRTDRHSSRLAKRARRRRPYGLEWLESRTLLTYTFNYAAIAGYGFVTVNESGGSDSFTVKNNGSGLLEYSIDGGAFSTNWNPGHGSTNHFNASGLNTLTINLGSDNSQIIDGDSTSASSAASNVFAFLSLNAMTGNTSDSLTINDQASANASGTYTVNPAAGVGTVYGPTGGPLTAPIKIGSSSSAAFGGGVTLNGSNAGNTFDVLSTYAFSGIGEPVTLTGGTGNNTAYIESTTALAPVNVNLGTGTNTVYAGNGGVVSTLAGNVVVTDGTTLNIDDSSDTNHATATLDNLSGNPKCALRGDRLGQCAHRVRHGRDAGQPDGRYQRI